MANATIVMKLQGPLGPIDGECNVEGYEKFIDLDDWSWTLKIANDKPNPTTIRFSKPSDRSSIPMLKLLYAGELAPSAVILVEEDSADSAFEVRLTLTNVQFTSFSLNGKVDEKKGSMQERWEVRADDIAIVYRAHAEKGDHKFKVKSDPSQESTSPGDKVEEKILELALKLREDQFDQMVPRLKKAIQQRKTVAPARGDKKDEHQATTI